MKAAVSRPVVAVRGELPETNSSSGIMIVVSTPSPEAVREALE